MENETITIALPGDVAGNIRDVLARQLLRARDNYNAIQGHGNIYEGLYRSDVRAAERMLEVFSDAMRKADI